MPSALAGLRAAAARGSASGLADQLLALFEFVADLPDKVQWVSRHVTADLGEARDAALERACSAVAAAIDAQPASFDRHGYHNRQHFCEVALTACGLCLLNRLSAPAAQFVVLAALMHDVVHEGHPHPAFVLERASVETMRPLLQAAGLDAAQIQRLQVIVLATEPAGGIAFVSAACRTHADRACEPPPVPAAAPELAALLGDAELAGLARLLCEADVLPSVGLGAEHAVRVQQRLAREWQRPLGLADKRAFIDLVVRQGYVGAAFLPRIHATRAALDAVGHVVAEG